MTAEVAIMNKSAIALAADSAVTGDTRSGPKVYDTADKLFRLSKIYPIGIMLYDVATFMGIPWETIIKEYRDYLGEKNFDFLEDFCESFFRFLENHDYFFPEEQQKEHYRSAVFGYFNMMKNELDEVVKEKTKKHEKFTKRKITQLANETINEHLSSLKELESLEGISKAYKDEILEKNVDIIEQGISEIFEKLLLNQGQKKKLKKLPCYCFVRTYFQKEHLEL